MTVRLLIVGILDFANVNNSEAARKCALAARLQRAITELVACKGEGGS